MLKSISRFVFLVSVECVFLVLTDIYSMHFNNWSKTVIYWANLSTTCQEKAKALIIVAIVMNFGHKYFHNSGTHNSLLVFVA